jgi:hypothetical protein
MALTDRNRFLSFNKLTGMDVGLFAGLTSLQNL